jgi:L-ascorbate metabolism protein UlaG (beta-lactamase superfamily)
MYRQGLGDCFLISLPRIDRSDRPFYVMIDCGVVLGTPDPKPIMTQVIEDIVHETGGAVDLLVATHEHWDHLSGFVQAEDSFKKLAADEVWLAWTEDPKDELTRKLKEEKGLALASLRMGLSHLQLAGDSDSAAEFNGILEFFGMAKGATTGDALKNVREKTSEPRYCRPTDAPVVPAGTNARFYVLGPPHDEKMLREINPSGRDKETYGLALGNFQMFLDGAGTALGETDIDRPFDQQYEIPFVYAQSAPELEFFRQHYWQPDNAAPDDWRRIDSDWLDGASNLALQLDSLTNNTSLVLAIELADGDVLLFAADAQVGNWLSWQERSWTVDGKTVTGPDLLKRTILYKVGHHGSHNATLKEQGLEQMGRLRVAMIPVDHAMAVKKRWGKMPLDDLVDALKKQAKGVVLRVDEPKPATQENVVEQKLYFEVSF